MPSRSALALLALTACMVVATVAANPAAGTGSPGPVPAGEDAVVLTTASQPTAGSQTTVVTPGESPATETLPPSAVTYRLQLQPDGDGRWRISATFPIRDEADARAFADLAAAFEESDSPLGFDSFRAYLAEANATTDRDMGFRNLERSHSRANGTGTLAVSFTWTNFAQVDGNRLSVGDAFNTTDGTWFGSIPDRHRLLIAPPDGYGVSDAPQVEFVDRAAMWEGPYTFDGREPWIVYSGDAPPPTTSTTGPGNGTSPTSPGGSPPGTGTDTPPGGPFSSAVPFVLLVVVAGVSATVLAHYIRTDDDGVGAIGGAVTGGDGGESGTAAAESAGGAGDGSGEAAAAGSGAAGGSGAADAAGTPDAAGSANADGAAADGESGAAAGGAADAAAGGTGVAASADDETGAGEDAADDDVDVELLSDEERVERLLDRNGGRMKQASIVKETGWSNAKVSQLLSAMAENERIDKLRIGRENLISFPDEDVTDIDSE